jgi:hypothetical protein
MIRVPFFRGVGIPALDAEFTLLSIDADMLFRAPGAFFRNTMAVMNTLKRMGTVGLVLFSTVALTVALPGETVPGSATGSASLGTFNRYIFRGYRLGRDSIVFEPVLSVSTQGFSVIFWGNIDMREKATPCFAPDRPGRKSFNETDLTLFYTNNYGHLASVLVFGTILTFGF